MLIGARALAACLCCFFAGMGGAQAASAINRSQYGKYTASSTESNIAVSSKEPGLDFTSSLLYYDERERLLRRTFTA